MGIYDAVIYKKSHQKDSLYEKIQDSLPEGWELTETDAWLQMQTPGGQLAEQGWKGHVSAVWYEAESIAERVMPVLIGQNCSFKIVKNIAILQIINDCHYPMSGANKFITFYPETEEKFVGIMKELYRELAEFQGPRIYTDMQCQQCSCLHYRYGGFVRIVQYDRDDEKLKYYMRDLEGKLVEDSRKPWYQEPEWVMNPFRSRGDERFLAVSPAIQGTPLENYRIVKILGQANKGNVYDAVRVADGRKVVLKEARPFIVYGEGQTAFSMLENEYKMLVSLEDTGLVPRPLELFACNGNLYLAEEKAGGESLRKYLTFRRGEESKLLVIRKLLSAVEQLAQRHIAWNDLTPNNIMVTEDMEVKLIDFENACIYAECSGRVGTGTKGFYNTDAAPERSPWSQDLFGLAMSILGTWFESAVPFYSDEAAGEDRRSVIDKVMEQVCLADAKKEMNSVVRNTVYSLLMQSEQREAESLQFRLEGDGFPFPADGRWKVRYDRLEQVCLSFLQGLYQEAKDNLNHARQRLWESTEFGRTTSPLNIQHGVAGIAGFLLEIAEVEPYRDIVEKILQVVEDYLETRDVFQVQGDNSLLFGNHGVAWFLYDFYCQRKKPDKVSRAIRFARELPCDTEEQDYGLGLAGYGCTYLKFWQATGDVVFLQKAVKTAEHIYGDMIGQDGAAEGSRLKPVKGKGFAHGEAGLLYFLYVTGEAVSVRKFQDCVMERMPRYMRKVGEIIRQDYTKRFNPDLSWCKGLAGMGTLLAYLAAREDEDGGFRQKAYEVSKVLSELMWRQSGCRCHGNAGSVEFLMDMEDLEKNDIFGGIADVLAKYLYTQRFYDAEGNVRFTDESRMNRFYDYGTGATGTMRAILRARGIVRGQLYMVRNEEESSSFRKM